MHPPPAKYTHWKNFSKYVNYQLETSCPSEKVEIKIKAHEFYSIIGKHSALDLENKRFL